MCDNGMNCSNIPTHPRYHVIAHGDYNRALRDTFWRGIHAKVRGLDNSLIPYAKAHHLIQLSSHHKLGVMDVELDKIVGSSGRYRDFDSTFLPVRRATDDRWVNIAQAHLEGVQLPPVKLYKLDNTFFVEDGNHRVSVAAMLGLESIRAQVIEIVDEGLGAAD